MVKDGFKFAIVSNTANICTFSSDSPRSFLLTHGSGVGSYSIHPLTYICCNLGCHYVDWHSKSIWSFFEVTLFTWDLVVVFKINVWAFDFSIYSGIFLLLVCNNRLCNTFPHHLCLFHACILSSLAVIFQCSIIFYIFVKIFDDQGIFGHSLAFANFWCEFFFFHFDAAMSSFDLPTYANTLFDATLFLEIEESLKESLGNCRLQWWVLVPQHSFVYIFGSPFLLPHPESLSTYSDCHPCPDIRMTCSLHVVALL